MTWQPHQLGRKKPALASEGEVSVAAVVAFGGAVALQEKPESQPTEYYRLDPITGSFDRLSYSGGYASGRFWFARRHKDSWRLLESVDAKKWSEHDIPAPAVYQLHPTSRGPALVVLTGRELKMLTLHIPEQGS